MSSDDYRDILPPSRAELDRLAGDKFSADLFWATARHYKLSPRQLGPLLSSVGIRSAGDASVEIWNLLFPDFPVAFRTARRKSVPAKLTLVPLLRDFSKTPFFSEFYRVLEEHGLHSQSLAVFFKWPGRRLDGEPALVVHNQFSNGGARFCFWDEQEDLDICIQGFRSFISNVDFEPDLDVSG